MIYPCVSYVELRADGRLLGFRIYATDAKGTRHTSNLIASWKAAAVLLASEADRVGCHGCYRGIPNSYGI